MGIKEEKMAERILERIRRDYEVEVTFKPTSKGILMMPYYTPKKEAKGR